MFSVRQKRIIAAAVQDILRATNHPELPPGEIQFHLHVDGAESWSWADIKNNGAVPNPGVNPYNEAQARRAPMTVPALVAAIRAQRIRTDRLGTQLKVVRHDTGQSVDINYDRGDGLAETIEAIERVAKK